MEITLQPVFSPEREHFVPSARSRVGRVLLVSVVLHFLLITILALQERNPAPVRSAQKPPIAATLYPAPVKRAIKESVLRDPPPQAPSNHTQKPLAKRDSDSREIDTKTPVDTTSTAPSQASNPEPKPPAPAVESAKQPLADPAQPDLQPAQSPGTTRPRLSSRQALDGYFSRLEEEKRQAQAEQAARDRREQQRSPVIVDTRKDEPEEDTSAPPPVDVDCSSTTTKTLSVISRFTGGRVTCSDRSTGFDTFIDKRLNKGVDPEVNPDNRR